MSIESIVHDLSVNWLLVLVDGVDEELGEG
jgi:hypothetical protein